MSGSLLALSIAFIMWQASHGPKVNRIFVSSHENASIIFEYANAALPEDEPLSEGAVDCLVSELKATGFFDEVHVELSAAADGRKVDVNIVPEWKASSRRFLIEAIKFDGFVGIDEEHLRAELRRMGIAPGEPLLHHPVSQVVAAVRNIVREMSSADGREEQASEQLTDELSMRVMLVAPERVEVVIASGKHELCQP